MYVKIKAKGLRVKIKIVLFLFMSWFSYEYQFCAEWTGVHHQHYNAQQRLSNTHKKSLLFSQANSAPFTQLIFSWNAVRPENGFFSFYIQVRDTQTKEWGVWHHMVDWGKNIQQSYISKSDGISSFVHVRLELEKNKTADAFRIKIEPRKGASLSLIHTISVAFSNYLIFKTEAAKNIGSNLSSFHIIQVPKIAQFVLQHEDKGRICSPVSCAMLLRYVTGKEIDPLAFAMQSFDNGLNVYGSWPCNIAHAFEQSDNKIHFFVRRMNSFTELYSYLQKNIPIIVSVRGNLPGALKPFPHGHLIVVVGWDNVTKEVLCHDPAAEHDDGVVKRYPLPDFLRAWEASHRLSYIAEKDKNL
jgi:hypothetical protein